MAQFEEYDNPWSAENSEWYNEGNDRWFNNNEYGIEVADETRTQIVNNNCSTRKVTITLTSIEVGKYEARSYPHDDIDNNGKIELYNVPVHKILIEGKDDTGNPITYTHKAPRFMPFYNNPNKPNKHYKSRGWLNAGLSSYRKITISKYIDSYRVQNRFSPGVGAIVLKGAFYIHAGPADLNNIGFGSAGCVEIIGDFNDFKNNIKAISGCNSLNNSDDAIKQLISDKNLIVIIEKASVPNIKNNFTREI